MLSKNAAATSRVENSAQGSSCQLKFVHAPPHLTKVTTPVNRKPLLSGIHVGGSTVVERAAHNCKIEAGNTKGGSITVPLTSCLTGLELAVSQLTIFVSIFETD